VSVSEYEDRPELALETYTFTFAYFENAEGSKDLSGVTMKDPSGSEITVRSAQQGMQKFNRQLIEFCGTLPDLPGKPLVASDKNFTLTISSGEISKPAAHLYR
jgi:hypothetical protein